MDEISSSTNEIVDNNAQNTKKMSENEEEIRQNLVETAVKFLNNPKVRTSPVAQKKAFLADKGLTDAEITEAIERSGHNTAKDFGNTVVPYVARYPNRTPGAVTTWFTLRDYFTGVILIGGAAYGLYHVLKRYVIPYVTGVPCEEDRLRNVELKMLDFQAAMNTAMSQLHDTIKDLQVNLQSMNKKQDLIVTSQTSNTDNNGITTEFDKLHSEITSLKGLLLNRHQFPATPIVSPLIPSWQLKTTTANTDIVEKPDSCNDHENGDVTV